MQIQFTSRPCLIMGKSDSLAQAFQNIISNAISFNDNEKGPVVIKVMREPQEKLIQIMIEDHGLWIRSIGLRQRSTNSAKRAFKSTFWNMSRASSESSRDVWEISVMS